MESENNKEASNENGYQHGKIDKSLDELITNEDKVKNSQNYSQGKKKQESEDASKQRDERSAS